MSNQLLTLLRTRRSEPEAIAPSTGTWSTITEWHTRTRPMVAQHFGDQLDALDSIINVNWTRLPKLISMGSRPADNSRANAREKSSNDAIVRNAHSKLLAFVDAIVELIGLDVGETETHESDSVFADIDRLIADSYLPQQFKNVVAADLNNAQIAYRGGSFKGCVVMLGAALEGIMLGTLQRADILAHLASLPDPPGPIRTLGNRDPLLADKIGNDLGFEDYKVCIHELVSGSDALGVDNIQSFRNAIHPWKTIQEPLKYGNYDRPRAIHYVASLQKIVEALHQWSP